MDGNPEITANRVAVLAGGDSTEREISFASGQQVAIGLSLAGYEPVLIDPAESEIVDIDWPSFDVCFIALHGGAGEDGRVQQQLERLAVPFTGSGVVASRLALDKGAAKQRFIDCGVPTLPFVGFDWTCVAEGELPGLEFPLVVKPNCQGSSLGVAIAHSPREIARCLEIAGRFGSELIAEPFVAGREFTVALLGRDPLPMIEIVQPQSIFGYDAKYSSASTQYRFEFDLPASCQRKLYDAAVGAAHAIDTEGLVRVDLMLDKKQLPWVLEVNTIPGMTARSMAPQAAQAAGIDLTSLVDWMVRDAIQRFESRSSRSRKYLSEPLTLSEKDCL